MAKRKKKLSEKEQFFAARGVPPEAVEPEGCSHHGPGCPDPKPYPPPSLLEERIAHLEKQNAVLSGAIQELTALMRTAFNQTDTNIQTLLSNDQKLAAAIATHHHSVFGVI